MFRNGSIVNRSDSNGTALEEIIVGMIDKSNVELAKKFGVQKLPALIYFEYLSNLTSFRNGVPKFQYVGQWVES